MKVDVPTVTRSAEMCEGLYCWNSASVVLGGVHAQEDEGLSPFHSGKNAGRSLYLLPGLCHVNL